MSGITRFTERRLVVAGVETRWLDGGSGEDVVVLLHGFPATSHSWRHVAHALAPSYRVIVPDLRGVGVSAIPDDGYDKRTMARHLAALLDTAGVPRAAVIGHDMGALVAYAFARLFPDRATHLGFVEQVLAGFGLEAMMDFSTPGRKLWHFVFHQQPAMPEALIAGREDMYLEYFWNEAADPTVVSAGERDLYVAAYRRPEALTAGLNLYRTILADGEANRADAVPKLSLPTLAVGGATGAGAFAAQSLREAVIDVRELVMEDCGHWPQLEQPDVLIAAIQQLLTTRQT